MFQRLNKMIKKKKDSNKGAAIVMVIVALAFIGMLVTMVLYMAYFNYLMKATDKSSKNNFYSAESALALINAGLQKDVNDAIAKAYVLTTQVSTDMSNEDMEYLFRRFFLAEMKHVLAENDSSPSLYWRMDHIHDMLDADDGMQSAAAFGQEGAWIEGYEKKDDYSDTSRINTMTCDDASSSSLALENLRLTYVDDRGYVSVIQTDVRILVPTYKFAAGDSGLNLENYSIIANKKLVNSEDAVTEYLNDELGANAARRDKISGMGFGRAKTEVTGNVFGGSEGVYVNNAGLYFVDDTADSLSEYNLVAKSLNVKQTTSGTTGLDVGSHFRNYLIDIDVADAGKLSLSGNSMVRDDLDITGKNANVALGGRYIGFGNSTSNADKSSSIMVNGANVKLDMTKLQELKLCGDAYVGATHYDADLDRYANIYGTREAVENYRNDFDSFKQTVDDDYSEDIITYEDILLKLEQDGIVVKNDKTVSKNSMDVVMGQSVAVKADQLMYMVPAACIGYVKGGKQVMGSNPLTYTQYQTMISTFEDGYTKGSAIDSEHLLYQLYNPAPLKNIMNGKDYGLTLENGGILPVFRRINGTVLVYLYFNFNGNQRLANEFFRDYAKMDPEGFNSYVKSYIADLKVNPSLTSTSDVLKVAGNAIRFDGNKDVEVIDSNMTDEEMNSSDLQHFAKVTAAMMSKLSKNANDVSADYDAFNQLMEKNGIERDFLDQPLSPYEYLVDTTSVEDDSALGNKDFVYGDMIARTVVGDYRYKNSDKPSLLNPGVKDIKVLVATGNVYLDTSFDGLVVAGGSVYIGDDCDKVTYNASDVYSVLKNAKFDDSGVEHFAYEIFGEVGRTMYNTVNVTPENKGMDTAAYIKYDNWQKE